MSFVGNYVQNLSNLLQNDVYNPLGQAEASVAKTLLPGATAQGDTSTPTAAKGTGKEGKIGSPGGILGGGQDKPPSLQQDINQYMAPYMTELTALGPEYAKEMEFLKPYMEGNPGAGLQSAVANEYGGSGVKNITGPTPQGEALGAASAANAKQIENFTPGFGALAAGAKQQEQTGSYADVLNAVLGAGKNELLYGSVPNFSAINTSQFPPSIQALYGQLQTAQGGGSTLGVNPLTAANQLTQQQAAQQANAYSPGTQGSPAVSGAATTNIQ